MKRWLGVAGAMAALILVGCQPAPPPPTFHATDITGAAFARDFKLTDHNGQPRTLASFKGKVVAIFFGYTHCPDVCPTTLSDFAAALQQLGPQFAEAGPEALTALKPLGALLRSAYHLLCDAPGTLAFRLASFCGSTRITRTFFATPSSGSASKVERAASRPPSHPTTTSSSDSFASP